jgi:hypothetical protein
MTDLEIIFGLGNLILPILTYFSGVQRTESKYEHGDRQARISHVSAEYLKLSQGHRNSGVSALIQAGIWTLKDDPEIRAVIQTVIDHGDGSPFGSFHERMMKIDLWGYFNTAKRREFDFRGKGEMSVLLNEIDHFNQ